MIIVAAVPFLIGAGCAIPLRKDVPNSASVKVTCDYKGKTYDKGAARAAEDACNACTCGDSGWSCTTYSCKTVPGSPTGIIKGTVKLPPDVKSGSLQVCAEPIAGPDIHCTAVPDGETNYAIQVPLGRWWVYAAVPGDPKLRKAYFTQAMKCDGSTGCSDHSLIRADINAAGDQVIADPKDWAQAGRALVFEITPSKNLDKNFFYDNSVFQAKMYGAESVEILAIPFPGSDTDTPKQLGYAVLNETDPDGTQIWTLPVPVDLNARDVWAKVTDTDGMTFRWKGLGWVENQNTL